MLDIHVDFKFIATSLVTSHVSVIYSNIELKNKKYIALNMHESFKFYIQRRMSNSKLKYAKYCNRLFERLFVGTND